MSASDDSDRPAHSDNRLMPKHGGYANLRSFHVSAAVYDGTVIFCDRFIDKKSRTHDQMVQAARSGTRNITEGSLASGTSKKTELKLTNVARASLEELLRDYLDFLRHRQLRVWDKNDREALAVRQAFRTPATTGDSADPYGLRKASPEVAANTMLCLVNQASYLLRRQLQRLESDFLDHGGFTERLYTVRSQVRQQASDRSEPAPSCPNCGRPMCRRLARQGAHAGQAFWGCTEYPECKGTRD